MSAGASKWKFELILTFCGLFVLVLAASVYRTMRDSKMNGISISLSIPMELRGGDIGGAVDEIEGGGQRRLRSSTFDVRLAPGSYRVEDLREEVMKYSVASSPPRRSGVDSACDLYLVEGSGVTVTSGTSDTKSLPRLILDTDYDDAPISICITQSSNDRNACELALADYIERGKSALSSDTKETRGSILPYSISNAPEEQTSVSLTLIEDGTDARKEGEDVHKFIVEHTKAALSTMERAGALPFGATVRVHSYDANTVYASEGLMSCSNSRSRPGGGSSVEVTVDLRGARSPSGEVKVVHCRGSAKAIITTTHNGGGNGGAIAVDSITKEVLSVIRGWAQLPPYATLAPSPSLLVPRARLGGIHPWELVVWRAAMTERLWKLLGMSLPSLASSLALLDNPEAGAGAEVPDLKDSQLTIVLRRSLGETVESARQLQGHLHYLSKPSGSTSKGEAAFTHLVKATVECQRLLYDPALLATLYFPFEQQMSVYAPFWIPVFAPIAKALLSLAR
jgi:hypothetical protein